MLTIRYKNKRKDRKLRIVKIRKWMKESRMKTVERKKLLRLVFPEKEALDIIHAMEFENTLNKKEKEKIGKFLLKRKKHDGIHFTQGAAFIFGYK
jgi:hypothetical protein